MTGTFSQAYATQFSDGVTNVVSHSIGSAIVEAIFKQLPSRKVQSGDGYADQARNLLRAHLEIIAPEDQTHIRTLLHSVATSKREIESSRGGSLGQRFLRSRTYKRRSKKLYVVVKSASDRGIDESLFNQMRRAAGDTDSELDSLNPFRDPSLVPPPVSSSPVPLSAPSSPVLSRASSFTNASVDLLNRVELTTYEAEATGDVAVNLTLHNDDETTEEVLAQIPYSRVDRGVQTITIISVGTGQPESRQDNVGLEGVASEGQGDVPVPGE
ncbi:hypothetical protein BGW80DRAFT_921088 [Lactifluus volemus]|nr:hypothetical protein BGW80DRAFT_921088 [Lactifluus volemus]